MTHMRNVAPFPELWARRTTLIFEGEPLDVMALPDLVAAKKTQRDKDWPMIRRLVDVNYPSYREEPTPERILFWLRELRTADLLVEAARAHADRVEELVRERPLLKLAISELLASGALDRALRDEEDTERRLDAAYWKPLREQSSAETEEAFLEHLRVPRNRYVAWRALLTTIRTPRAYQALLNIFRDLRQGDYGLARLNAVNLLEIEETRKQMAALLWEEFGGEADRWDLINYAGPALEHLACLDTMEVRRALLQVALRDDRYPGEHEARLSAIDGVARFDPQRAFDAARRLMLAQFPLCEKCPERLLHYNTEGALDVFEEIMKEGDDFLLLAAIGEALDRAGLASQMQDWLRSPSSDLARGACFAAEAMRWTEDLDQALVNRIRDEDWDVRKAAKDALETMRRHRKVEPLVAAFLMRRTRLGAGPSLTPPSELATPGSSLATGETSGLGNCTPSCPLRFNAMP